MINNEFRITDPDPTGSVPDPDPVNFLSLALDPGWKKSHIIFPRA
jgi:hypothetical protein